MTTWRKLLAEALEQNYETFADIVSNTMTDAQMDAKFRSSFDGQHGIPFTAWTANTVYFPAVNDGVEWVACVSRNPDGLPTEHIGGDE
jgi:hypothetical protein